MNKTTIDALRRLHRELGVTSIEVEYCGSGDEGGVEDITYSTDTGTLATSDYGSDGKSLYTLPVQYQGLREDIDAWAASIASDKGGGFDNEGSYGSIRLELPSMRVTIDHNWNVMTSEADPVETYDLSPDDDSDVPEGAV